MEKLAVELNVSRVTISNWVSQKTTMSETDMAELYRFAYRKGILLNKPIKPEELRKLYFPYHSLDPLQAIERIEEDKGLNEAESLDDIARGVIILRKVRTRK